MFGYLRENGLKASIIPYCRLLKEKVVNVVSNRHYKLKKTIVFECESDMDDNPRALYEYMIEKKMNREYHIVWIVKNVKFCRKEYHKFNVEFISRFDKSLIVQMRFQYLLSSARWFVFSHPGWFQKKNTNQIVINVWHGIPLKGVRLQDSDISSRNVDYLIAPTKETIPLFQKFCCCPIEKILINGSPRNDFLRVNNRIGILSKIIPLNITKKTKVVICMPTYRQSLNQADSNTIDKYSIDVINNDKELEGLNEFLQKNDIHLIIKIHPLQNKAFLITENKSNITYLYNEDLLNNKIVLYQLLGCCDMLLSDISSVTFDYMTLNRPIGYLVGRLCDYSRGFLVDNPLQYMPGYMIHNITELKNAIESSLFGEDQFVEQRMHVAKFAHGNNIDNCKKFFELLFSL